MSDYLTVVPLDPVTRYWFADGSRVESSSSTDRFLRSMEEAGTATSKELSSYLDYARTIWEVTHGVFMERSLHEPAQMLRDRVFWRSLARILRIDPFRTMGAAHRRFFADERARQLFNRYATYNGSNPFSAPATFNIIPHVECGLGAWGVKGGIFAIPSALAKLAGELEVRFRLGERVTSILADPVSRSIRGLRVADETVDFDEVVCNADVTTVYRDLLNDPQAPLARRYRRLEPSSSALVFFWAMGSDHDELGLHNIFFSDDYRREFAEIFRERRCPSNPTIYINITSKIDPSDAPKTGENWFVLVNAPADRGQDWDAAVSHTRQAVLRRLETALGRNVAGDILKESVLTPPLIAQNTSSHRGSLYGIASNTRMAAFLRHPNRSRRYPGLYFAGGSAHPGGGMPLVLLSGKIAAELAVKHGKNIVRVEPRTGALASALRGRGISSPDHNPVFCRRSGRASLSPPSHAPDDPRGAMDVRISRCDPVPADRGPRPERAGKGTRSRRPGSGNCLDGRYLCPHFHHRSRGHRHRHDLRPLRLRNGNRPFSLLRTPGDRFQLGDRGPRRPKSATASPRVAGGSRLGGHHRGV